MAGSALLLALIIVAGSAWALGTDLSATPLPILTTTSDPLPSVSVPSTEQILPTIGEGQSAESSTPAPTPTPSASVGANINTNAPAPASSSSSAPAESSAPASSSASSSAPLPSYSGGFVVKTARPASSGTSSASVARASGSVTSIGEGATGLIDDVQSEVDQQISGASGDAPQDNGTAPEGTLTSTVAVPGVGLVGVLGLLALAGILVRRRLP